MPRLLRTPLYLRTPGRQQTTAASPSRYPTHVTLKLGGRAKRVPVSYFWKDAISVGDYKHPLTKQAFSVDRGRIDGWVDKFRRMRAAGVEVPTPVDHSDAAEDNRGFVVDARREGGTLKLLHQAIGKDAAIVAARNRCSVYIDPDFRDGSGKRWGEVIAHSAYTPKPVVHGHGSFVPFAASRSAVGAAGRRTVKVPAYYLARTKEPPAMPATLKAAVSLLNKKERVRLRKLLKLDAGTKIKSDEVAGELLELSPKRRTAALAVLDKARARAAKAKADAAEADDEGDEDEEGDEDDDDADEDEDLDADDDDDVDEDADDADDADDEDDDVDEDGDAKPASRRRREAVAASRSGKIDPQTAALMASSYRSECEAAIRSGRVTPETIERLNKLLTDAKGRPNGIAMSMAPGARDPFAFKLMRALRHNKAVPMNGGNGRTRSQAFEASRTVPGSKKDREQEKELKRVAKETAEFAARRNGKQPKSAKTE